MKRQTFSLLACLAIATVPVGVVKAQQTAELLNSALRSRENGDYVSAEQDFQQAVRIDPENASLWNYLCSTRLLASNYKTAIDACNEALKLSTKYVVALGNRADAWTYLGEYDKAMNDINRAIALNPSYLFGYQLRGWLNIYKNDGDRIQSAKDFQRVLRTSPDNSSVMTGLGIVQMDLKDAFGAIRWFDKAIAISPKYAYAYRSRGIAREMMGDMTGACSDWRQAKNYGNKQVVQWIQKQCR
jgi:tetratricopeptide (TPR) repeat protein